MSLEAAFFGSVTRDAELKTSKGGRQYLRFSVRVGDGDAAQFVGVTCFDERAIAQADKFVKGARVYVEGSIKLDEWHTADGSMRHGLSCMSWRTHLSEIGKSRPRRESAPGGRADRTPAADKPQAAAAPNTFHDDTIPFAPEWRG